MQFKIDVSTDNQSGDVRFQVTSDLNSIKTTRVDKGKSFVAFPDNFTIIDIETTGFSPDWDEIIELSAVRYVGNTQVAQFSTLVKPSYPIDEYITELTGITNEMLSDAPMIGECIDSYCTFLGNGILMGYNVNFDINFIYDNIMNCSGRPLTNDFIDVMRIAKKALPELPHHRQQDIAEVFHCGEKVSHRALSDCLTCFACYNALKEKIASSGTTLSEFSDSFKKISYSSKSREPIAPAYEIDTNHPLYGKICVFTGKLEKMTKDCAKQIVSNLGGVPANNVTKQTNFLILGNNDHCKSITDGKSRKQKRAEELILAGADLQILSEQTFYDMLPE